MLQGGIDKIGKSIMSRVVSPFNQVHRAPDTRSNSIKLLIVC
jgi:hypothetical protein